MDNDVTDEAANTAGALIDLDLELRRHHYHSPDEQDGQLDLIEEGVVMNLEWDEQDGLWVQFDEVVTFDITPTRTSLCVYAEDGPVVTLWAAATAAGRTWRTDWEVDLTHSERQRFLRRVADIARHRVELTRRATEALRADAALEDAEERTETAEAVREWLANPGR